MKKLLSLALVMLLLAQFAVIPVNATETLTVLSTAEYAFNSTDGVNVPADATFTVPTGKAVKTLSLNGETIEEGDGETKWDTFPSAVKNYTYDSATGAFTISRRFIGVETDLYGARSLDFVLEFTDGTKGILRLKGKYNAKKLSAAPKDYSESYPSGYKAEEVKPTASWQVLSTAARQSAVNLLDGVTNQYHSYYANEGSSIIFRDNVPHYIDIDTAASTPISGVMYKPRTSGTGGCFTTVTYQGANSYPNFTDIKTVTYAGDLTTKITKFNKNVSYRYYRIKIVTAVSGYGTGDEIHFLKPYFPISDFSVDIAKSFKPTFSTGTFGTSVVSVEVDGKAISSDLYAFSNHSFTFSKDYIKSLAVGNHTMKICFDDSYTEFNLYIENSAKDLTDAKANAVKELNAYGKDASAYITNVENASTPSEVYEITDSAATDFGAEIVTLPYKTTYTLEGGEVLSESVSKEGSDISDTKAISYADNTVTAAGLGRALIKAGEKFYLIKTTKANIAVVIVTGQSNAAGDSSNYQEAPSALGKYKGRYLVTNSMNCSLAISDVTWEESIYAAEHGGAPSSGIAKGSWAEKGWSAAEANQLGARLADEWDMTVWVINTGICARIMDDFDPTKETHKAYTHTVNYTNKVKELIAEDPHYVPDDSKTGFFWLQGCSDGIGTASANTMEEYTEMFMNMYNGWKEEIGINYAGIWLVRAGVNSNGDKDFYMSGPRLSQHYLGNSQKEEHKNIYLIMNTDIWRTNEGVNDYFTEKYPDAEAFKAYYGYDRPSTFAEVKPDLHHRQKGYNELGDEAGRVISLIMNGKTEPVAYASLYNFYGNEVSEDGITLMKNEEVIAVPIVTSTYYNASYGLTVTTADSDIAVFDNDTYALTGVSEGETTVYVKHNNKTYASYPVVVEGTQNTILSDRSKWTLSASSTNSAGNSIDKIVDGSTASRWVADLSLKNPHHFEITLPEATYISGFSFDPFNNTTSGKIDTAGYPYNYEFYGAETDSGEYHLLKSGTFSSTDVQVSQAVDLGKNILVKKVKFVYVTSSGSYGAMSEFYLTPEKTLDPSDRSTWVITPSSVQGGNNGSKMVDGKNNTRWVADLTLKDPTPPHSFEISLPSLYKISGFSFDTYYDGGTKLDSTGYPRAYEFYGATSDLGEYTLLKAGTFSAEDISRYTTLELGRNVKVKKVKLVYKSSNGGYGAMSEFYLNPAKDYSDADPINDRSLWFITASSVEGTRGNPYNLVDGSTSTSFVADITLKTPPHHFEILLPTNAEISGVSFDSYTDSNGYPLTYEIYTADTEEGEYVLTKSGSFDRTNDAAALKSQSIDFGENVSVRKLKFVFVTTVNGYAAMSEFRLIPSTKNVIVSTTTATGGTVYIEDKPVDGSLSFNQGKEVTLKAVPEEGAEFKAWINASTGKIISTEDEYTFTAYTNRKLLALFADEDTSEDIFVSFISKNNQYIYYSYLAKGIDTSTVAPAPEKMYVSGYAFNGFTPLPGVVNESTDYRGNYTKNPDVYEITISGGTDKKGNTEIALGYNSSCTVIADKPAAGKVFTGWLVNGNLASLNPEFTFFVLGDMTLEATYGDSLTDAPFVALIDISKWMNGDYNMVSLTGTSYLPEGYTFSEAGILYVKADTDAETLILENEGKKVSGKQIKRTAVTENQMFKLSASYTETGLTARGYLVYLDSNGERQVIYSDITEVSLTVTLSGGGIGEDIDMDLD